MTAPTVPPVPHLPPDFQGSSASATEFADVILRASAVLDDLDTYAAGEISRAQPSWSASDSAWSGDAADAYCVHVRHSSKDAAAASLALRSGAKAVWVYADGLASLQGRHEALVDWRRSIANHVASLRSHIMSAGEDEYASLRDDANDLRLTISHYESDLRGYELDLQSNTADLVAALRKLTSLTSARGVAVTGDVADSLFMRPGAPGLGSSPDQVAAWWKGLDESQRFAVIAASPDVIGSADGLPASVRDQANMISLKNDIDELDYAEAHGGLSEAQQNIESNIRSAQDALDARSYAPDFTTIDPITSQPIPSFLLLYQPNAFNNDGAVAIAIGDPDTADNVAVIVPGIRTDAQNAEHYAEDAANVYESARLGDPHSTTATISWIGYDAPNGWGTPAAAGEAHAIDGGHRLSQYVDGLQASREGSAPHMTVIGHSYGSTTAAHATSDDGLAADELVLLGSPGAGRSIDYASQLDVDHVWAGNNSRDIVVRFADDGADQSHNLGLSLGNDTGEDHFKAIRFEAEAPDRMTHLNMLDDGDHLKYFTRGSESCINLGEIVVGDYDDVTRAEYVHSGFWDGHADPEWGRTPTPTITESYLRGKPDA